MKITKSQLRQIIKEELDAYNLKRSSVQDILDLARQGGMPSEVSDEEALTAIESLKHMSQLEICQELSTMPTVSPGKLEPLFRAYLHVRYPDETCNEA